MNLLGNTHVAEVYPLTSTNGQQYAASPLAALWYNSCQPEARRDIIIDDGTRSNQWVGFGEPTPEIKNGWKLKQYIRSPAGGKGAYIGEFHVTDCDSFAMGGVLHHQEIHMMKIDINTVTG